MENIISNKKYKILGDSFKQYRYISANTFEEGKTNLISDDNINEIIENFNNKKVNVFVYHGHKQDQSIERIPIGKIENLYKCNDSIGLEADIIFFENAKEFLDSASFYPSIEMLGIKITEDENNITWGNCELKALAFVEYPASKNVDLLCASGIINNIVQKEGGKNMDEKLKELIEKIKNGDEEAKKEFFELINKDEELKNALLKTLLNDDLDTDKKTDDTLNSDDNNKDDATLNNNDATNKDDATLNNNDATNKDDDNNKDEKTTLDDDNKQSEKEEEKQEASLSAITFEKWTNEFAEKQGAIRCSSKSIEESYTKAKKLHKAGFSKDEIINYVKNTLIPIGINSNKTEKINLSAINQDKAMADIANIFK